MARKKELTLETEKTVKKENYIKELAKKLAKEKTALRNLQKEETDKQKKWKQDGHYACKQTASIHVAAYDDIHAGTGCL